MISIEKFEISEEINTLESFIEIVDSIAILFNQINEKLDESEDSIKLINFGSLFKQELDQTSIKINENIESLIAIINKSIKKVDKSLREDIKYYSEVLTARLSSTQQILQNIIEKTLEMPKQVGIFKEYRGEFKQKGYIPLTLRASRFLDDIMEARKRYPNQRCFTVKELAEISGTDKGNVEARIRFGREELINESLLERQVEEPGAKYIPYRYCTTPRAEDYFHRKGEFAD